jgi:hypothetical protein
MKTATTDIEVLTGMYMDILAINRATGNVAALTLCDLQADLCRIADGLVWGG